MKLIIQPSAEETMKQHAIKDFPDECCGFLYGKESDEARIIETAVPVENKKEGDKKRRFEISGIDYMRAEQHALKNKIDLLGVYHSHPQHPAIASEHDLKQAMPFFSYVILSVMDKKIDDIKSWKLNEENTEFIEETIIYH
ncbi:MAG: family peptidase [Bacteroidota bacterium]|nr:family peptidase [Bacteroidota bacterium]